MLIVPSFSLVKVKIKDENVEEIMNTETLRELKAAFPFKSFEAKRLRKNKKVGHLHGPCIDVTAEYRNENHASI